MEAREQSVRLGSRLIVVIYHLRAHGSICIAARVDAKL